MRGSRDQRRTTLLSLSASLRLCAITLPILQSATPLRCPCFGKSVKSAANPLGLQAHNPPLSVLHPASWGLRRHSTLPANGMMERRTSECSQGKDSTQPSPRYGPFQCLTPTLPIINLSLRQDGLGDHAARTPKKPTAPGHEQEAGNDAPPGFHATLCKNAEYLRRGPALS
jgi:hypothetical protein